MSGMQRSRQVVGPSWSAASPRAQVGDGWSISAALPPQTLAKPPGGKLSSLAAPGPAWIVGGLPSGRALTMTLLVLMAPQSVET